MAPTILWLLSILVGLTIIGIIIAVAVNHRSDWEHIVSHISTYTMFGRDRYEGKYRQAICVCNLEYSKSRNKYRITHNGYNPVDGYGTSSAYNKCIIKQAQLENKKNERY